jgi:P-loop Domain of unknown function (DUF2791)
MKGAIINHPLFGRGQVLELRNAGRDSVVRFDSGIRANVPSNMLSVLEASEVREMPKPFIAPRKERTFSAAENTRIESRHTIEALRYGLVPAKRIRELSVGLDDEKASLQTAFANTKNGGDVRVVVGEYGAGKSHFFEFAAQESLANNFIVANTSLDLREVPPNRPQRIYLSLMRSLRFPDSDEIGLLPLLEKIVNLPNYAEIQDSIKETFFATVLHNYSLMRETPNEALALLVDWASGEKVFISDVRRNLAFKSKEFQVKSLSQLTTAADQYSYLLNGWGWLAKQAGYNGLAVFIDESEHYSLLNVRGKEKADNFFKALIYTALGERGKINENDLVHQHNSHPFRLKNDSHLLLLFALTPTANTFDYKHFLESDQILHLKKYLTPNALDELLTRLYVLHRQSYAYENHAEFIEVSQGLLECLDNNLINLRQVIRLSVEIFDLCYAYQDYNANQAVAELRKALL